MGAGCGIFISGCLRTLALGGFPLAALSSDDDAEGDDKHSEDKKHRFVEARRESAGIREKCHERTGEHDKGVESHIEKV
jgi:hypothetical protein